MAVTLIGSVGTTARVTSGTTITGAYGQSPTANNLLVALISRVGSGTATAPSVTGATGWTRLISGWVTNIAAGSSATASNTLCDVWYRVATGGDTAPQFTMSGAGTTLGAMTCTIYELSGANTTTPLDVSGTESSGSSSATISSVTTTTSANVNGNATGLAEFAISIAVRERAAIAPTITYSASWVNGFNDGATSSTAHTGVAHLVAPTVGATASDVTTFSSTATTAFSAGIIVVIAAAAPNNPSFTNEPFRRAPGFNSPAAWARPFVQGGFPPVVPSYSSGQPAGVRVAWQRRGSVFTSPVTPAPPPAPTPAKFYPLNRPVQARRPQNTPPRGRATSMALLFPDFAGPAITPPQGPVRARQPLNTPVRGRTAGRAGVFTPVTPTQATFYPLNRAVQVRRPLPPRGVCRTVIAIAAQYVGPPFYALNKPAAPIVRVLPLRGRTRSGAGVFGQLGPPVYPLQRPVAARIRPLPVRGRTASQAGTFQGTGAPLTQLRRPVQARQPLTIRGRTQGRAGTFTSTAPVLATFYPLNRPVAAVSRVLPLRGRTAGRAGLYGQLGPHFAPPARPVQARQPLPVRGRTASRTGLYGQLGPTFTQLNHPVQARRPLPVRGTTQGRAGTFSPITFGTAFYPLNHPAEAVVRPLPIRGRTASRPGIAQGTGAPLVQLRRPVAAIVRVLAPRGRTASNPGVFDRTGPAVSPLQRPVAARTRPLPPRGTAQGRAGVFTLVTQAGPPIYPLRRPAAAVIRPLPQRGRAQGHAGVFQGSGPAVKPLQHPVYAWRPGPRRGLTLTSIRPAPPVANTTVAFPLRRPVQSRRPLPPKGHSYRTPPYVAPFVPAGGHGYPYTARLVPARWSAFLVDTEWKADQHVPIRYFALSIDARWPAAAQAGRWFVTSGPA